VNRQEFDPEDPDDHGEWGNKYDAGMIRVDIPSDDAAGYGAAVVFMQDTCDPAYAVYEAYGISSLYYGAFTWLSDPDGESFDRAILPSLAIHDGDGTLASVTYLARLGGSADWQAWATLWEIDASASAVAHPTEVDMDADGEFILSTELLFHDWGTGSSLVIAGANDEYWAAWSDKVGEGQPNEILGSMGYAEP